MSALVDDDHPSGTPAERRRNLEEANVRFVEQYVRELEAEKRAAASR